MLAGVVDPRPKVVVVAVQPVEQHHRVEQPRLEPRHQGAEATAVRHCHHRALGELHAALLHHFEQLLEAGPLHRLGVLGRRLRADEERVDVAVAELSPQVLRAERPVEVRVVPVHVQQRPRGRRVVAPGLEHVHRAAIRHQPQVQSLAGVRRLFIIDHRRARQQPRRRLEQRTPSRGQPHHQPHHPNSQRTLTAHGLPNPGRWIRRTARSLASPFELALPLDS